MLERLQAFTKFDPQSALGYMKRRGYSEFVRVVVFIVFMCGEGEAWRGLVCKCVPVCV
jgi:hypothetical protein